MTHLQHIRKMLAITRAAYARYASNPEGINQYTKGGGGGGDYPLHHGAGGIGFDPTKIFLETQRGSPTASQRAKILEAYKTIDKFLHDPEIGQQVWSTLSSFTPFGLQERIKAFEAGTPQHVYGGLPDAVSIRPRAAAKSVDAALNQLFAMMADKEVGPTVQAMVKLAIKQKNIKTAGGVGSGIVGHTTPHDEAVAKHEAAVKEHEDAVKARGETTDKKTDKATSGDDGGVVWDQPLDKNGRPIPIKVDTVEEAVKLIQDGKVVEVKDLTTAHTLIEKMAAMAEEAKAAGKDAKDYDLCNVSVGGSNLFCVESVRNEQYPKGIERIEMPQLGGLTVPGTEADKLEKDKKGEVDATAQFMKHLEDIGMKSSREEVPASELKASQRELRGNTVAGMMMNPKYDPAKIPIFISRDNYVVDGHHRWAAVVGRDSADGHLGDSKMNVIRIDAPISEVLRLAKAWSEKFGIAQAAGPSKAKKKVA
jgi:hypothetical protein